MSENFYKHLKNKHDLNELPVSNVLVLSAIGQKTTPVRRQILVDVSIGNKVVRTVFLIVPHLVNDVIFGNDWLFINKVVLDYGCKTIELNGVLVAPSFCSYGRESSEQLKSFAWNQKTYIQVVKRSNNAIKSNNRKESDIDNKVILKSCENDNLVISNNVMNNIKESENVVKNICVKGNNNIDFVIIKDVMKSIDKEKEADDDLQIEIEKSSQIANITIDCDEIDECDRLIINNKKQDHRKNHNPKEEYNL
nr:uncharacterized protein LOC124223246 [Neodiprion pinetum]